MRRPNYIPKAILDDAIHGILVYQNWKALYANQKLASRYGYDSPEEIMALESTKVLIHPDFQIGQHEHRLKGEILKPDLEVIGIRKDGSELREERRFFL